MIDLMIVWIALVFIVIYSDMIKKTNSFIWVAVAMIMINVTAFSQECLFSHIETKRYSIPIPDTSEATIMVYNQAYLQEAQNDQDSQLPDGYRADFIDVQTNYLNSDQFYYYVVMIYSFEICKFQAQDSLIITPDLPDPEACFDENNIQIECDSIPIGPDMPIDSIPIEQPDIPIDTTGMTDIPTMGQWGKISLSLLFMICGVVVLRNDEVQVKGRYND